MLKKTSTIVIFLFLIFLSFLIFLLSTFTFLQPIGSIGTFFIAPVQKTFYQIFRRKGESDSTIRLLQEENDRLQTLLVDQKKLIAENNALKDQFRTTYPKSPDLLPASILGAPGFVPGVMNPEMLILDKGKNDGVLVGQAVLVKNTVIGTISRISTNVSVVSLLVSSDLSFTAKTLETQALGVVDGGGGEGLTLRNVLLSQNLKRGDLVVTKGDMDQQGKGLPPDLTVGRIVAVDKKASSLFQTARLKSPVDLATLTTVFIFVTYK